MLFYSCVLCIHRKGQTINADDNSNCQEKQVVGRREEHTCNNNDKVLTGPFLTNHSVTYMTTAMYYMFHFVRFLLSSSLRASI